MDRTKLIKVISGHSNTVPTSSIENLADDILAVVDAHYEKMAAENRVKHFVTGREPQ